MSVLDRSRPAAGSSRSRRAGRTGLLLALLGATVLLALGLGSVRLAPLDTLRGLWHGLSGAALSGSDVIVWQLRFPRVALGLLVGAALGLCGAAYQGVFRNPLADPYLMGVASGAGLGATLAVVAGWPSAAVPPAALLGALLSVSTALALARQGRTLPPAAADPQRGGGGQHPERRVHRAAAAAPRTALAGVQLHAGQPVFRRLARGGRGAAVCGCWAAACCWRWHGR